ncbi:U4/U6.U5 tri-snRNP component [Polychytrium aggregatum]|uniref:U4/U6.U5 tri-snRNP component n=1 Tax=Polychytrium aggregatum TaxID=110093 RepID=UPI0022FEB970|nr:U4/U6.U5 tri-snRNP component [Polychytrium aggregatum]KAI9192930.1 U4/U6.U5 tri-snRNP component [Polychytrium aggregatum]
MSASTSSSTNKGFYSSSAGDTDFRRKWDKDEFAEKARLREQGALERDQELERKRKGLSAKASAKTEPEEEKALLKAREERIDFTVNLNKTQVVQVAVGSSKQPGFYCEVCDCTVKDNVSYLDHINGKKHQQNLGISMKVERSTFEQVKARLEALKRKTEVAFEDLDTRIEKAKKMDDEERRLKKERKREKKQAVLKQQQDLQDNDVAEMMGFGGFGSSKK